MSDTNNHRDRRQGNDQFGRREDIKAHVSALVSMFSTVFRDTVLFGSMTDINRPGFLVVSRRHADGTADNLKDRRRQDLGSVINIGVKGTF